MWKKRNAHFASWQFCREWLSWSMTEKIINFELMGSQNISIFICRWNSVPGKMGGAPKVGWCAMLAEMLVSFSDDQKSEDIVLNFCCDWDPVAVDCAASCRYMRSAVDKPTPGYDARPDYVRLTWLLVQCHSVCICQVIISMGKWSARSMPPPSLHRLWRWL